MKRTGVWFLLSALIATPLSGAAQVNPITWLPDIVFSEVLANPTDENSGEFIELYNQTDESIDLSHWKITDAGDQNDLLVDFTGEFDQGAGGLVVPAHGFAVLVDRNYVGQYEALLGAQDAEQFIVITTDDQQIGNGLGNSGDTVTLSDGTAIRTTVSWSSDAGEGLAWKALGLNAKQQTWVKSRPTLPLTPGAPNNEAPSLSITTTPNYGEALLLVTLTANAQDPEEQPLQILWDFGDLASDVGTTTTHQYSAAGIFTVTGTAVDSEGSQTSATTEIVISEETPPPSPALPTATIRVNEILPDPDGDDSAEFIELYNVDSVVADLTGYQVDDAPGGSTPYILPATTLAPHSYLILDRKTTNIVLNNSGGEQARLLAPDGSEIAHLTYVGTAKAGQSWSWFDTGEEWANPTPGTTNQKATPPPTNSDEDEEDTLPLLPLTSAREYPLGDVVRTAGTISAALHEIRKNTFYIQEAGAALQVSISGTPPTKLARGTAIELTGELGMAYGEKRIKVRPDQIVVGTTRKVIAPKLLRTGSITKGQLGQLVRVSGTLVQNNGTSLRFSDGSGVVQVNTGSLKRPAMHKGQRYTIVGVVTMSSDKVVVRPRSSSDLVAAKTTQLLPAAGASLTQPVIGATLLSPLSLVLLRRKRRRRTRALMQKV